MNIINYPNLLYVSLLSTFLYSLYIKCFKRISQTERALGLESHKIKNGTITMGGIIFIVTPLFFINYDKNLTLILVGTIGYGLLGLADDLLIILFKNNKGISPLLKLLLQTIISGLVFYFYILINKRTSLNILGLTLNIKWLYGLLIMWILVSSTNAWNLLDGVDGLCAGCSLIFGIGLGFIAYKQSEYNLLYMMIVFHVSLFIFWCFNLPKAFLFMGNVGSLSLGAFYACISIYLNSITSFIVMALLFIFETLSVILQVIYFKKTNGKRLFKMAPFHHHLEKIGFKEIQVDLLFYLIQIVLVILVIIFSY